MTSPACRAIVSAAGVLALLEVMHPVNNKSSASAGTGRLDHFAPGALWPDTDGVHINAHGGGILLHDGIYYWFGEHKIAGKAGNDAHVGVRCYSSTDLYNWRNEGVALAVSDDPASDITKGCILERPKVLFNAKTGKFVMWFHLEPKNAGYSGARSGVAVSDSVVGPYRFIKSLRPDAGHWPINVPVEQKHPLTTEQLAALQKLNLLGGPLDGYPRDLIFRRDFAGGQMARDMTLFLDDDGAAYHLFASEDNGVLHISRLSDDFLSHRGQYVRAFPGAFNEAPAVFKRHGKYFLFSSGCTGWFPNPARLSVADSIYGSWQDLGNPCIGSAEQMSTTFDAQSTYVLPVAGQNDAYIFMADRWRPDDAIDGRYVWLPIQFDGDRPFIEWKDRWDLGILGTKS